MHIHSCKLGDQFYFDDCIWTITGEVETTYDFGEMYVFRECYNHDTMEFYSLNENVFSQFKQTEWSVE